MRVLGHAFAFVIVGSGAAAFGAEFEPPKSPQELEKQILAGDAVLFEQGFNRCDLGALRNIMHPDVVMIHDQSGTNRGIEDFIRPVKQNICNGSPKKPLRTLDPGTTKIFPLYNNGKLYGALQSGKHSFFIKEGKNEPYLTNRARFFTEWRLTTSGWKMKTAYSFQHMNPTENPEMDADVLDGGFDGYGTTRFMLDAHKVRGQAVAILRRGKVTEVRAFGDRSATEPVAVDTRFNVASLAKPVTALTVLRLVSAGQWDLDEPLARYYVDPELRSVPAARRVTARHVLTHSSGLPNWRYLTEDKKLTFLHPPGQRFEYSGEGFEWLRRAMEKKTGQTLEALARQWVFTPAGMTSTSYLFPKRGENRLSDRFDAEGKAIPVKAHTQANGAANLITSAGDYGRFLAYIAAGAGLNRKLYREMVAPQIKQSDSMDFGLGWSVLSLPGGSVLQHSGADPGVRSLALLWPGSGNGLVILANSDGAIPTWQPIITELFGQEGWALLEANGR